MRSHIHTYPQLTDDEYLHRSVPRTDVNRGFTIRDKMYSGGGDISLGLCAAHYSPGIVVWFAAHCFRV